ncbi:hypothetical protein BBD31_01760 [Elizabethkingia anophelis]|uniref:hypothetical protein n=1 Tax=Elizabethkingia anophelis TaxID=1117645 RepID=UPI00099539B4|nr:hypothetical protein [Elizabethkingia anophelis]AQW96701.1 hypothetical protein BBD31_01760 [Elizabethkingia anophelis]MDV3673695.1 hypothetical protein [Elizabethkingia anophelis]MDV3692420.1 hypothetical protein [Elizabethkingia anophelis]OPB50048.1 hypothetical protein BAY04_06735 [Elizabethkingia anophelis]SPW16875.1 Uncharacterised protein [Elizabethkingia anophelis]
MKRNLLSYIALVISIIAISASCFAPVELKIDNYNSIISSLSVLITILIGWQIYVLVDYSKYRKEISADFESFKKEMNDSLNLKFIEIKNVFSEYDKRWGLINIKIEGDMASMYYSVASVHLKTKDYIAFLENMINCIIAAERVGNIEMMNNASKHILIHVSPGIEMSEFQLSRISTLFYKGVNKWNKTLYYKELERLILSIIVNEKSESSQLDSL